MQVKSFTRTYNYLLSHWLFSAGYKAVLFSYSAFSILPTPSSLHSTCQSADKDVQHSSSKPLFILLLFWEHVDIAYDLRSQLR
jgi:hypothetical protein